MGPLLEQFLIEARENLKFIEEHLEELGVGDDELLNSIFRAAHTLKGGSGIVGFDAVKNITHKAEDLLDNLRSKKICFQPNFIDALYDAFDEVLNLVDAAEETGDIVSGDDAVIAKIVANLNSLMGKEDKKAVFALPFALLNDAALINKLAIKNLSKLKERLPFERPVIGEANIADAHLYAIFFDVTEDCMVYGNDPIYALSLLGSAAFHISSCMNDDDADWLLNQTKGDEEFIHLKLQIMAFVYAPYERIEEALYNFLDDLLFYPMGISDLLSVNIGEAQKLDFLKDFAKLAKTASHEKNPVNIASLTNECLKLLNQSSKQGVMLRRLMECLHLIREDDLPKLRSFFDAVLSGEQFDYTKESCLFEISEESSSQPIAVAEQPVIDITVAPPPKEAETAVASPEPEVAPEPAKPVALVQNTPPSFNEKDAEIAKIILTEQLHRLECENSDRFFTNILSICKKCCVAMSIEFPNTADIHELKEFLSNKLGIKPGHPSVKKPAAQTAHKEAAEVAKAIGETEAHKKEEHAAAKADTKKDVIGKVVKVEQESIDTLMSIVGELLVAKNSLPYLADSVASMSFEAIKRAVMEKYSHIDRLSDQLQDIIMSMRMLPVSYVFDRYPKLVRDISKNLNKKVRLIQDGAETKLDKNMIEMLADPLVHIVRNSLDHGVETPEERKAKGKDEVGTVRMLAYPQSDKVIIEIEDDGKGIDGNKVASKVLEKGLLSIEKIEGMSEQEKLELIMLPGLSTAETISEYSGRGVGMDVVRKSVENFGGTVDIKSTLGLGTTIKLSIPVSLAVTNLLHVMMAGANYGFAMECVFETVKMDKEQITFLHNEPFIYIREHIIPVLFIKEMLDTTELGNKPLSIVVLNIKGNLLAVVVNELIGQLDVVLKPMEGILREHPLISGTALLGNGQIIMILDQIGLLGLIESVKNRDIVAE